ncbi:MAG: ABC transporter substrate-binding protein [Acidimicrobiales bacterium]
MERRRVRFGALAVVLAITAGACGSSSDDGTAADGTVIDNNARGAAQSAIGNTSTTAESAAPTEVASMDDWLALWDTEREALKETIAENGWGWDQAANKVTGPGGFEVDLSSCPAGWDAYQGLDGDVIHLGQTMAQSGTLADYGNIGIAQTLYYNWINEQGGITDSTGKTFTIETQIRDDAYDPAKTVPLVDELLDSQGVFALQTLGSPNTMKVYDKINQRCVPQPYVMTGHPAWGDPVNHPWTWGMQLAYNTEAILWGGLLEQKFADRDEITVAALIMQNDFGKAYELGFNEYVKTASKPKINFVFERIDPTAATVTNQMTTLAARNPDVFIAMTAGTSCTQAVIEAANNGLKNTATMLFQPSVCKSKSFVGKDAVGGDGSATNGWWIVGGGAKDFTDPALADDPFVAFALDLLEKGGSPISKSATLASGFGFAWPLEQSLRLAAELPGGLSRPNFMLAARVLDMTDPNLLPGIRFNMSGNDDAYPTEGSEFGVYDSSKQSWVTQTDLGIIELSGKSKPCAWDQSVNSCG